MLQRIYRRAEIDIVNELARLRAKGLIDYHAVSALLNVQKILLAMQDRAGKYIPRMVERYFYANHPEKYTRFPKTAAEHREAYKRAALLSAEELDVTQRLENDLMFKLAEASANVQENLTGVLLGRQAQVRASLVSPVLCGHGHQDNIQAGRSHIGTDKVRGPRSVYDIQERIHMSNLRSA